MSHTNRILTNDFEKGMQAVGKHLNSFPKPQGYQHSAWEVLKEQALLVWEGYLKGETWDRPFSITCKESYLMLINREGDLILQNERLLNWVSNRYTSAWATRLELIARKAVKDADFEKALRFFTKAARIRPQSYFLRFQKALVLEEMGKIGEALKEVNACIALEPGIDELFLKRGELHCKLNKNQHALYDFGMAIRLDPKEPKGYVKRSLLLKALGQVDKGKKDLDTALALQAPFRNNSYLYSGLIGLTGSQAA